MDKPFSFQQKNPDFIPNHCDNHTIRTLSSMKGQDLDQQAHLEMLNQPKVIDNPHWQPPGR